MEGLANLIVGLFKELRLPFRWVAIMAIIGIIVVSLFAYEQLTGHFYFSRLERKVSVLKELQILSKDGISQNPDLYPIYSTVISDLDKYEIRGNNSFQLPSVNFNSSITWWKALSGASFWLIMLVFFLPSQLRDKKGLGATLGAAFLFFVIAALMGFVGAIIPTIISPWVNYLCFPILQIALLVWLLVRSASKSKASVTNPI